MPESGGNSFDQTNAAIINAAAQLGNTAIASRTQYEWSKKAAEDQNKRMLEWWNMQNEYNTPKSQLQRYLDAGLNPNLLYGQMQNSNAGDVGTPKVAERQSAFNSFTGILDNLMNMLSKRESIRAQELENRKRIAELSIGGFGLEDADELPFGGFRVGSYQEYLNELAKFKLYGNAYNSALGYPRLEKAYYDSAMSRTHNSYLADYLAARNRAALLRGDLMEVNTSFLGLRRDLQREINSWYNINQWSNIVDKGIGRILDVMNFFSPKIFPKMSKPSLVRSGKKREYDLDGKDYKEIYSYELY